MTLEKGGMGGWLVTFKFFGYIEMALELLNFDSDEPSSDILGLLVRYDQPIGKTNRQKKNIHP